MVADASDGAGGMYEERGSDSPLIECVWQARQARAARYLTPAVEYWDLWFTRQADGATAAGLSGPTLGHRWISSTVGEHGWGVQLSAHVVLPGVDKQMLLGGEERLLIDDGRIVIGGHRVAFPEYDQLEDFVGELAALDVLRADEDVRRVLSGDATGMSERHRQRRVRAATGLTGKQITQLARAREAYMLLQQGVSPADCAARCGFADQSHLTRALRVFHGRTPARIIAGNDGGFLQDRP